MHVIQMSMLYDEGECLALDSLLRLFEELRMSNQGLLGESDEQLLSTRVTRISFNSKRINTSEGGTRDLDDGVLS